MHFSKKVAMSVAAVFFYGALSAGYYEISAKGIYWSYNTGQMNFTSMWALEGSLAYRFFELSAIEASYSYQSERNGMQDPYGSAPFIQISNYQLMSISWLQNITGSKSMFQPYIKAGVGYVITKKQVYMGGGVYSPWESTENFSVTGGAGLKIFISQRFALEGSGTVYVMNFKTPPITYTYNWGVGFRVIF